MRAPAGGDPTVRPTVDERAGAKKAGSGLFEAAPLLKLLRAWRVVILRQDAEVSNYRPRPQASPATSGRFGADAYADYVGARLLEFFADTTPWQRRLWDAGSVLALEEVHEASEWVQRHVLSPGALAWLARDVERLVGRDRAIGGRELRKQVTDVLRSPLVSDSRHHRRLRQLTDMIESGYLGRWADAVDSQEAPAPERLSRAVASHLLDRGYSMGYLHRWTRRTVAAGRSLGELLGEAGEFAECADKNYEVLIPFVSVPRQGALATHLDTWLTGEGVARWLVTHAGAPKGVRQGGGFVFQLEAKDPYGAAGAASLIVERMIARSGYARALGGRLEPVGRVWVGDHDVDVPLRPPQRGAYVLSLVAERRLYAATERTALDDALELAAPLNHGSPGPAVSGGWAAIEALLIAPRDVDDAKEGRGAVAADRLAALVACSWPRSEFTALSYEHQPSTPDRLALELGAASTNRERSTLVADALVSGRRLALREPQDFAAESRMRAMLSEPRATLRDVNAHVTTALRRLYRQRNIVMHGGVTGALALDVTLRTTAPLVGAGLDRIAHAWLADGVPPLALAERASIGLGLVGGSDGHHVADLLE